MIWIVLGLPWAYCSFLSRYLMLISQRSRNLRSSFLNYCQFKLLRSSLISLSALFETYFIVLLSLYATLSIEGLKGVSMFHWMLSPSLDSISGRICAFKIPFGLNEVWAYSLMRISSVKLNIDLLSSGNARSLMHSTSFSSTCGRRFGNLEELLYILKNLLMLSKLNTALFMRSNMD